ncbi:MAG TPA: hypothetical protein DDX98_06665 [Bacteroidales bacterium]|jgi:hypothetical protein|nr:hypothetical protein [Bacteroidales bacterium]
MKNKNLLLTLVLMVIASLTLQLSAQDNIKTEALLTSKKWICLDVSRAKLEKMDFRFEVGNELSMRIDKKYSFKNNDYNFSAGTWKLDKKDLYFFYDDPEQAGRKLSTHYRIQKIKPNMLVLKRMDRPKGKLTFK